MSENNKQDNPEAAKINSPDIKAKPTTEQSGAGPEGKPSASYGAGKIFGSKEEAILAFEFGDVDLRAKIKVRITKTSVSSVEPYEETKKIKSSELQTSDFEFLETSVGRILFNESLPANFPFQNQ